MQIAIPNSTTALICGGTAPIGARIAIGLARAGCSRVVVCGRDRARGEATVEALRRENSGAAFAYVQADISAPGGADAMFAEAGPFDIYVHCVPPGGGAGGPRRRRSAASTPSLVPAPSTRSRALSSRVPAGTTAPLEFRAPATPCLPPT